jgi:hypothetical protein
LIFIIFGKTRTNHKKVHSGAQEKYRKSKENQSFFSGAYMWPFDVLAAVM